MSFMKIMNLWLIKSMEPWKGTGQIVVGDFWFGSVKSVKSYFK